MKMPDMPWLNVNIGSSSYKGAEHAYFEIRPGAQRLRDADPQEQHLEQLLKCLKMLPSISTY